MGQQHQKKGHGVQIKQNDTLGRNTVTKDFVLEKSIFNNIFEKDIRRVFIYKKAERLAKALHLIAPAFANSASLRNRVDAIAIGLVDAAVLPPAAARTGLSRELLSLSSLLSIARTGGILSSMNADLISREAHTLLQEIAGYEEPRLFLDEAPTLSGIAKDAVRRDTREAPKKPAHAPVAKAAPAPARAERPQKDIAAPVKDRQEAVLSVIRDKGQVSIKDISTVIRGVSEKTIQRELAALVDAGVVAKQGERRWSTYSLA